MKTRTNMVVRKSRQDIEFYIENGPRFGGVIKEVANAIHTGKIRNKYQVQMAYECLCNQKFLYPEFPFSSQKNYLDEKFGHSVCVSVNNTAVHGMALEEEEFSEGDIVSIDCGMSVCGPSRMLFFDSAVTTTYMSDIPEWVYAPREALKNILGIDMTERLNTHKIASVIQKTAEEKNLQIVLSMTGHGIGYSLHEGPQIHNGTGKYSPVSLVENSVFCVEPIFVLPVTGEGFDVARTYIDSDGWSVRTESSQPSSHFESMFCIWNGELVDIVGITEDS